MGEDISQSYTPRGIASPITEWVPQHLITFSNAQTEHRCLNMLRLRDMAIEFPCHCVNRHESWRFWQDNAITGAVLIREQDQTSLRTSGPTSLRASVRTSLRASVRTSLRDEGRKLVSYDMDWPHARPLASPGGWPGGGGRAAQLLSNCLSSMFIEICGAQFWSKRQRLKKINVLPKHKLRAHYRVRVINKIGPVTFTLTS